MTTTAATSRQRTVYTAPQWTDRLKELASMGCTPKQFRDQLRAEHPNFPASAIHVRQKLLYPNSIPDERAAYKRERITKGWKDFNSVLEEVQQLNQTVKTAAYLSTCVDAPRAYQRASDRFLASPRTKADCDAFVERIGLIGQGWNDPILRGLLVNGAVAA